MKIIDALNLLNLSGVITKKDIKKAYRSASLKYHPDRNPAGREMMQAINAAYDALKDIEQMDTGTVEGERYNYAEQLEEAISAIVPLSGLVIEICGNWVWVTGDTKAHKEAIKAAGYKWAKKKLAWYFRPAEYSSRGRGNWSMDQIREEYGSNKVKGRYRTAITQ